MAKIQSKSFNVHIARLIFLVSVVLFGLSACKNDVTPSSEFLDSKLIVRPGVDDLGAVTVRQFVEVLRRVQKPDGTPTDLLGWSRSGSGYTLRAKIASEFDLNFQWSKTERITLLQDASLDNGESVPGLQFFMMVSGMPKVATLPTSSTANVSSAAQNTDQIKNEQESIAAKSTAAIAMPKQTLAGVILQAFECNDTCQLKYADASGQTHTAICMDTKGCKSWAEGPKGFLPLIGAKADLVIGKKYVPEGGITMDNVEDISLFEVDPPTPTK